MFRLSGDTYTLCVTKLSKNIFSSNAGVELVKTSINFAIFSFYLLFACTLCACCLIASTGVASFFWFEKYNANLPDKLNYAVVPILVSTSYHSTARHAMCKSSQLFFAGSRLACTVKSFKLC